MAGGINLPLAITLTGQAQAALCVAWQMRDRPGADKATKTPSNPATGSDGAADRFCTWGPRAKQLPGSHRAGGVGIKNFVCYHPAALLDRNDPDRGVLEKGHAKLLPA
jgi:hypothetical protein